MVRREVLLSWQYACFFLKAEWNFYLGTRRFCFIGFLPGGRMQVNKKRISGGAICYL